MIDAILKAMLEPRCYGSISTREIGKYFFWYQPSDLN
jgi:hypothetical protein